MRHWATGVAVATSHNGNVSHGMTVNSFGSISLDPPLVTVTMANDSRTYELVRESGVYAITILSLKQQPLAELFAGRIPDRGDRMTGLDTFVLQTGSPLLTGGSAFIDCQVVHVYEMPLSTLFVGAVVEVQSVADVPPPLIYF